MDLSRLKLIWTWDLNCPKAQKIFPLESVGWFWWSHWGSYTEPGRQIGSMDIIGKWRMIQVEFHELRKLKLFSGSCQVQVKFRGTCFFPLLGSVRWKDLGSRSSLCHWFTSWFWAANRLRLVTVMDHAVDPSCFMCHGHLMRPRVANMKRPTFL